MRRKIISPLTFSLGVALLLLGTALLIIASTRGEWGFIVIIGPIPFFIGSSTRALIFALIPLVIFIPVLLYLLLACRWVQEEEVVV